MADQQALHAFAQWVAGCSGNEKQEAQTFVQKLLSAWGRADATEAGVSFEHKIPKGGPPPRRSCGTVRVAWPPLTNIM